MSACDLGSVARVGLSPVVVAWTIALIDALADQRLFRGHTA